ncbi:Sapep family Mn(2+)-dependent dipeptidase [Mogibacterium sp. NSJ-24]|jgi:succinyl-diaminopimelate desuccinylase|uniref:Sapep family Mn(2+)-dependent dipeptidase n=1 Tax=Lentihominibacter hominis TaxID=2763645 RepID=A0A926E8N9_9FIRM|nr:Sapep family Mn(2+)-dependent dipeptidase [Lentihominibacter hominis]MBC8567789.1 Sapep family Mn(2+)-dependent dipeptidase [Lentihominibacter hominis]
MNEKLKNILKDYKDEMTEKLQEFIRIKSVTEENPEDCSEEAPFGEGPKKAMEFMIELGKSKGFRSVNYDNMVCELEFGDDKDNAVGTIGHVDVVPAGGNWTYHPYGGQIHEGRIYGRGAVDDKGPTIAAFYAALAIKESGLPLSRNIIQIIGTNEEGGSFPCLRHYLENAERIPSCGIVPDSYFPICFSEKHFVNTKLTAKSSIDGEAVKSVGKRRILKSIKGGDALNVVPTWAEAVFADEDGNIIQTIRENGVSAHASTPWQGENAIAKLIENIASQSFEPHDICRTIGKLPELLCRDVTGEGLGICVRDETGVTTNNVALIDYEDGILSVSSNARLPLSLGIEEMSDRIKKSITGTGMSMEVTHFIEGFYTDPESEPARTLIEVYREETGDMDSMPYANGSGSYARIMKGFVPYGMALQSEPLQFHVEDESVSSDWLFKTAQIYAEALYRLAK